MRKYFFLALLLLAIDRAIKIIFMDKDFFIMNFKRNTGTIFGLFKGNNLFFIILSLIFLALIGFYFFAANKRIKIPLMLMFIGILSNLIDRIYYGYVIDFIDIKIWPVFNLADAYIVAGLVLLIIILWKREK